MEIIEKYPSSKRDVKISLKIASKISQTIFFVFNLTKSLWNVIEYNKNIDQSHWNKFRCRATFNRRENRIQRTNWMAMLDSWNSLCDKNKSDRRWTRNQASRSSIIDFQSYARFLRIVRFLEPMYLNVECRGLAVGMSVSNFALNREFFSFVHLCGYQRTIKSLIKITKNHHFRFFFNYLALTFVR